LGTLGKKKPKKGKYWISLVIDIRSSSIGAAVVKNFKGKNKIPVILQTYREQIFYTDKPKAEEFINRSYQTLSRVLDEITNKKYDPEPISDCSVFYGSPWYKSEIKRIEVKENKNTTLTDAYLKKVIKASFKDTNTKELLEQKCMALYLNGYKNASPIGKKFKKLNIDFYESILHEETYNDIDAIISKKTNIDQLSHYSHPATIFDVLSQKFEPVDNYTILDISGEITEMTVVREDQITKNVSIPHGSHFFVRGLAQKCNLDFLNSFSKLDMILNEEIDEKCEENSVKAFNEMKIEWAEQIRKIMTESNIKNLPSNVFVLVDNEVAKLTRNILKEPEIYSGALKFRKKPELTFINTMEMETLCVYRDEVEDDSILALEASFVEMQK
jgi:hypothetical protein